MTSEPLEPRRLLANVEWNQVGKLLAADGAPVDYFGYSVALSGNTALVGAQYDDSNGTNAGSAYLFDLTTGQQIAKLKPTDGATGDLFGRSVALSGNVAIVGSMLDDDNGTDSGSAYLFDATTGAQIAKLKPSDGVAFDQFGIAVAIDGNLALVGSAFDDDNGTNSGSAYLFDVITGTQIAKLKPTDGAAFDQVGMSVAISGNVALVGSPQDDDRGHNSGSAYVFDSTTGAQIAKLTPADGATYDSFGISVAISGNVALVGSAFDDDNGTNSGSAYLFNATTGVQISKLRASDRAENDQFGQSVALSGNTALVGSHFDVDSGVRSGSAYLFDATSGTQIAKIKPADGAQNDYFGWSVALSGNVAVIGSFPDDDNGTDSGSAYVFDNVPRPKVEVRGNNILIADEDSSPSTTDHTDFGTVEFNAPVTRTFTVRNSGTGILATSELTVPTGFTVTEGLSPSIPRGGVDTFTVRLDATIEGTRTGEIRFLTNDAAVDAFNFAVRGVVNPPVIEIEVRGNNLLIVDGDSTPSSSDNTLFGTYAVGFPVGRTYTVRNLGNGTLITSGLQVPPGFTVVEDLSPSIPAGGQDTFSVRFDVVATGTFEGEISFNNNDPDENPYNFAIRGVGVPPVPEVAVTGSGSDIMDGDTTPSTWDRTDFGIGFVGSPVTRSFIVRNLGTATLTTSGLTVPAGFTITEGLAPSLPVGAQDSFSVRLDATAAGTFGGDISFDNNDADENPFNFTIVGVVLPPGPEVEVRGNNAIILDGDTTPSTTDHTDFGTVSFNAPLTRTFTVRNLGNAPLTTVGLTVPAGFKILGDLLESIPAGGQYTFTVRLDATAEGTFKGDISFSNNDVDEDPFNFAVQGVVNPPMPEIEVTGNESLISDGLTNPYSGNHTDFLKVNFGSPRTRTFTVRNRGTADLVTSGLAVPPGFTITEGLSHVIPAGSLDTFSVRLDAAAVGTFVGEVRFDNNDSDENPFNFAIRGEVIPLVSEVEVRGDNVIITDGESVPLTHKHTDFSNTGIGSPRMRTYTVRNLGTGPLTISDMTVPAGFTITEALDSQIPAGGQDTFSVRLDAEAAGTFEGEVRFTNDDPDENPFNFAIRGVVEPWSQVAKLQSPGLAMPDRFGFSVAISGNLAVIGRPYGNGAGDLAGSAFVFDVATGVQLARLSPASGIASVVFGYAVAISGNTVVVGDYAYDDNGAAPGSGIAYVFNATTGAEVTRIVRPGTLDSFGASVAISGNTVAVGTLGNELFLFSATTGSQITALSPPTNTTEFGREVAMSGNTVVVGNRRDQALGNGFGSVSLFNATTGARTGILWPSDGEFQDQFGNAVAISGNRIVVGAYCDDDNGYNSGSVYVFDVTTRAQIAKLKPSDGAAEDYFGYSLAVSGNLVLVGSWRDDDDGPNSGSAYLFDISTGAQVAKFKPSDGAANMYFGHAVALGGSIALVGSSVPLDGTPVTTPGPAYLFDFDNRVPLALSQAVLLDNAHQFAVTFNEPINPLSLSFANVTATAAGETAGVNPTSVTWSANNTVATFTFPTLPDGDYRFTLDAGAVRDVAGNSLASAVTLEGPDVFILAGDANRDRRVDFADLLVVAQNYGQSGKTFSQGNFDYSPDGLVDFSDLLVLAQRYGTNLIRVEPRPDVFASRSTRRSPLEPDEPALI